MKIWKYSINNKEIINKESWNIKKIIWKYQRNNMKNQKNIRKRKMKISNKRKAK